MWQGRFGGDASIVGRTIRVNGTPTTVIGVMPSELLILGTDLWIPWGADPLTMPRNFRPLTVIGRLAPGATLEEANSELATIAAGTTAAHAGAFEEYQGMAHRAMSWTTALMRDLRSSMLLLLGAVALVLLIACANLSSLALARSAKRQREMAICLALGAGRWGLARQQLAEVVWLALAGGGLGLLVAYAGTAGTGQPGAARCEHAGPHAGDWLAGRAVGRSAHDGVGDRRRAAARVPGHADQLDTTH